MTTTTTLDIRPIAGLIGAEVFGLDLRSLDDDTFAAVHQAFLDHHVLVFRGQDLSPADQIAFGHRFGDLDEHPYVEMNADHPEILDVVTRADDKINFGGGWHTDVTFLDQPDLGSILYARRPRCRHPAGERCRRGQGEGDHPVGHGIRRRDAEQECSQE